MHPGIRRWLGYLLLFGAVLGAAFAREGASPVVDQAIIWLPSGVAVAGLWLVGLEAWWVVALATALGRVLIGYFPAVVLSAALGSTAEAVVGVLLLRRLGVRPDFSRLRDVLGVCLTAAAAPLASIFFSGLARSLPNSFRELPFYSGWNGWWRMNALGILTVVPPTLLWLGAPRERIRTSDAVEGGVIAAIALLLVVGVLQLAAPGTAVVLLLPATLPVALYAGVRFGQRGAVSVAALSALAIAVIAEHGGEAFLTIPRPERHVAIQILELTLVAVPLVLGALLAEREVSASRFFRSESVRRALQQVVPDTTYRLSADGTWLGVFVPPDADAAFPAEQLLGRRLQDVLPAGLAARMLAAIREADAGARPAPLEYRLDTADGPRIREARYVRLAEGEVLGVVRDITQRHRSERLMTWQTSLLELIATGRPLQEVLDALVRGIEQFSDGGLCSVLTLEGRALHVACAPSLPREYNRALEGALIGPGVGSCGTAAHENRTVVSADITTDPLWQDYRQLASPHGLRACWSVPIRGPGGMAVLGTFAVYYRTPRSPTPEEIALVERAAVLAGIAIDRERREGLLASINRNVNEGLYRSTPDRGLVYVNQAFARMFGYESPEEMLRLTSSMLYEDPARREELKQLILSEGCFVNEEVRFRRRDGSLFWGLVTSTGVHGPEGQVLFYDGAVADITARRELEDQLRQALKMEAVGKLAGGIAHDFNNLLTAIAGYAESVREAVPPDSEARADVDEVVKAADRAASLTRQLLAYSRQQMLSPRVLDLAVVVDQLGGMLRRLVGEDMGLVTQHAPGETHVRVDRGQLEQVIVNLVVNARDAMPDGGTLTISTAPVEVDAELARAHVDLSPGPYVALVVHDTGEGMSAEVQRRAFDPFFTTKAAGKGTGLGLSTVYGIVNQSGGAVWLESAPGAGTTVTMYLPRVAERPEPETVTTVEVAPGGRATVLVVEDERLVRDLVQRTLERAGYRVLVAADGQAALELAGEHPGPIDLLLTDVVMPRMGGRELAARLLRERAGTRVLFMSGYATDMGGGPETGFELGEFLQKPFAPSRLLERVGAILESGTVSR